MYNINTQGYKQCEESMFFLVQYKYITFLATITQELCQHFYLLIIRDKYYKIFKLNLVLRIYNQHPDGNPAAPTRKTNEKSKFLGKYLFKMLFC